MSRNLVPRVDKGADLGTQLKNWNKLYVDAVILRNKNLQTLLDGKTDLKTLTNKGDLYVATNAGEVTRLPAGTDGYVLKANSGAPEGLMWGPAGARQELTGNITVTVGDNGDFPTINAALENVVALYYPKYISGRNCPRVTINLLPGFVMNEQVLVDSLDLSWITITGNTESGLDGANVQAALDEIATEYQTRAEKGLPNGYASLDSDGYLSEVAKQVQLSTPIIVSLTGEVLGSVQVDLSSNVSMVTSFSGPGFLLELDENGDLMPTDIPVEG